MIKKAKLLLFTFALVIACFIGCNNVFAFNVGETFHRYANGEKTSNDFYTFKGSKAGYSIKKHAATQNATGQNYDIICLDPTRKATNASNQENLVVEKVLDGSNLIDSTILYIINSNSDYYAKVTALRAFIPVTDYADFRVTYSDDNAKGAAYALINSGLIWTAERPNDELEAIIPQCNGGACDQNDNDDIIADELYNVIVKGKTDAAKGAGFTGYSFDGNGYMLNEDNETVREAKSLLLDAIVYGANTLTGKNTGKEVIVAEGEVKTVSEQLSDSIQPNRAISREYDFSVTFKGFASNEVKSPVYLEVNPDETGYVQLDAMKYNVLGSGDEWTTFTKETDLSSLLTDDDVTIQVKALISANVGKDQAVKLMFHVNPQYKVVGQLSGAYLYPINNTVNGMDVNNQRQRFFVGSGSTTEPMDDNTEASFPYTWDWTCEAKVPDKNNTSEFKEWINQCCKSHEEGQFNVVDACVAAKKANDQAGIDKWCNLKENYCDVCSTKVNVPFTCQEFAEGEFEKNQTATITGPENIKVCIMEETDDTNHEYKVTKDVKVNDQKYNFSDNKYCNIYCKEDYNMELPAGRYAISGRYFDLQMNITGTKTCYSDMIDTQAFREDITAVSAKLKELSDAGRAKTNDQEFMAALDEYNKIIKDMKACNAGWDDEYDFNPDVAFDYDEEYIDMLPNKELKFKQQDSKKSSESWYCKGEDVNQNYNECINGKASNKVDDVTDAVTGVICNKYGETYSCSSANVTLPLAHFAKKSVTIEGVFAPEAVFYTKYSTGIIETDVNGNILNKYTILESTLESTIPESDKIISSGSIPVSLKDNKGVYNYNIKFSDIGEFYDKANGGKLGRLVDKDLTSTPVAITNSLTNFKGTYVCSYVINCPNCPTDCIEDPEQGIFCEIPKDDCTGPECPSECSSLGCAYDEEHGLLYSSHQVELMEIGADGRTVGQNWDAELNQKAAAAIEAIEAAGESIYETPEYSFRFTPAVVTWVRNYNDNVNDYLNDSLYCKNFSEELEAIKKNDSSITAEDIAKAKANDYKVCKSEFLDKLVEENSKATVKPTLDGREKIQSFLLSDYCKNNNNVCTLVGTVGPAWK